MKKFLKVTGLGLVAAVCVASIVTGLNSNKKSEKTLDKIDKFVMNEEEKAQKELEKEQDYENVELEELGEVVSTKHISDAYLAKDTKDLNEEDIATYEEAKKVIESIIKDGMSDYEKEKAIYDWMVDNISNNSEDSVDDKQPENTIAGVLKGKVANELSTALTFRLLANMANLDCMVVHDTSGVSCWNICKLDDNCWYYVYTYMDLKADKYWNFNCDKVEDVCNAGDKAFPDVNGTKYCYMTSNSKEIKNPEELIKDLKKVYDKKNKKDYYVVYCMSSADSKNVSNLDYVINGINNRTDSGEYREDASIKLLSYEKDEKIYIKAAAHGYVEEENKFKIDLDAIEKKLNKKIGEVSSDDYYQG